MKSIDVENESITFNEMMNFIEQKIYPLDGIVDTDKITKQQILKLYKIVKNTDELFKNIVQIYYFQKTLDEIIGVSDTRRF